MGAGQEPARGLPGRARSPEALDASSGRWNAALQQASVVPECVREEIEAIKAEDRAMPPD